jgi:hypothetical protein
MQTNVANPSSRSYCKKMKRVFVSWQSDSRAACNRTLIQDALEIARKEISESDEINIEFALDRDTANTPGSPDIAATILEKIRVSDVFIADVTCVGKTEKSDGSPRHHCNPNVLLELGYAIRSLTFSKVLLVQNTYFGDSEEHLPFDIRGKRAIRYCSGPDDTDRAATRQALKKQFLHRIVEILTLQGDVLIDGSEDLPPENTDPHSLGLRLNELATTTPDNVAVQLDEITRLIDSSEMPSERKTHLYGRIVDGWRRSSLVSKEQLLDVTKKSLAIEPTPGAYFNQGFLLGALKEPYSSVAAYMKAIEAGDINPSLCYLNASRRFMELDHNDIALSMLEKSFEINPQQSMAWFTAARLYADKKDVPNARRCYEGYLAWYNGHSEDVQRRYRAQARVARSYLDETTA